MKRLRYVVVAALAAASIGFGAAPASACQSGGQPGGMGGCCQDDAPNVLWREHTGNDLYTCPWIPC